MKEFSSKLASVGIIHSMDNMIDLAQSNRCLFNRKDPMQDLLDRLEVLAMEIREQASTTYDK